MKCPTVFRGNLQRIPPEERPASSERWCCHPIVKNSDPEYFLSKRTAREKMEKRGKGGPVTGSNWDPAKEETAMPDTIIDATVCLEQAA